MTKTPRLAKEQPVTSPLTDQQPARIQRRRTKGWRAPSNARIRYANS